MLFPISSNPTYSPFFPFTGPRYLMMPRIPLEVETTEPRAKGLLGLSAIGDRICGFGREARAELIRGFGVPIRPFSCRATNVVFCFAAITFLLSADQLIRESFADFVSRSIKGDRRKRNRISYYVPKSQDRNGPDPDFRFLFLSRYRVST